MHVTVLGEHRICLDRTVDRVHVTDAIGARMLAALADGEPVERIVAATLARHDVDPARVRADVERLAAGRLGEVRRERADGYVPDTSHAPAGEVAARAVAAFELGGRTVAVVSESEAAIDALARFLPRGGLSRAHAPSCPADVRLEIRALADERFAIVHDGRTLDTADGPADAAQRCLRGAGARVARIDEPLAVLHAAGLARGGDGLAFAAPGGTGKTTLAAWFVGATRARATDRRYRLLDDDAVPIRLADGRLVPAPIAPSIKDGSLPVLEPLFPDVASGPRFGRERPITYLPLPAAACADAPVECRALVLCARDPGLDGARLVPLPAIEALAATIDAGVMIDRPIRPERLDALIDWVATRSCLRLEYGRLDAALESVDAWLDARSRVRGGAADG